jgi:queuosine precursor transporter
MGKRAMSSASVKPFEAHELGAPTRVGNAVRAVSRLIFPTMTLSVVLAAAFFQMEENVIALDWFPPYQWQWNPGYWLTAGHLLLPLSFFVVNITNRKRGPHYALGQVVASWVLLGMVAAYVIVRFGGLSSESPFPPLQTSLGFMGAFVVAQLVNIRIYDRTRGRTWWGAPLISVLWACAIYVLIFHPVSMLGMNESFVPKMVTDFTIKAASAVILLIPYALMRRMVKPAPGYGGA